MVGKDKKPANIVFELFGLLCFEDELSEREGIPLKGSMAATRRKSRDGLDVDVLRRIDDAHTIVNLMGTDLDAELWSKATKDPEYLIPFPSYERFCRNFLQEKEFYEQVMNAFQSAYPLLMAFLIANSLGGEGAVTQVVLWLESQMDRPVSETTKLLLNETYKRLPKLTPKDFEFVKIGRSYKLGEGWSCP